MNSLKPTFKQAMDATLLWCKSWEIQEISDEVLAERISELLLTVEGARGFFVISLSIDSPLMDRLPDPLIYQFREAGKLVIDLTVKNLAMSSAMAIQHKKDNNFQQQLQSERINARCIELLKLLETNSVKERLEELFEATKGGKGKDTQFLKKWSYTKDQINAISNSILEVANIR